MYVDIFKALLNDIISYLSTNKQYHLYNKLIEKEFFNIIRLPYA